MLRTLRAAPITVPTLAAVAIFLAWVPADVGQAITAWAPAAIGVLALLGLACAAVPLGARGTVPRAVRLAVGLLAAFTAWSYLSILWADDQGVALQGADRTLLYLAVFTLFALWPQRPGGGAVVAGAWTLGMGVLAVITLVHLGAVSQPRTLFNDDRFLDPAGYPNAAAALWLIALWPAITFAAAPRVPWALRGLAGALAVVFLDVALLSQSRGAVLAIPVCAVVFVALVPGRLRHIAVLVPIGLAALAAVPTVLDVGPAMVGDDLGAMRGAADAAVRAVLLAAVGGGLVVAVAALLETRRTPTPERAARVRRAWGATVVGVAVVVALGGLAVAGGPVKPLRSAWTSFKGGYENNSADGNRLVSGLGSNRYDFYRIGLDVFVDHPITGVGADNFFQDYLQRGRSAETPSYPHDLAIRTLAQTGLVGAALLLGAFAAALLAAWRAMRRPEPYALAVAGGATMGFVYWLAHGSTDWFWEWAGLGAPAFALLGLAVSMAPRAAPVAAPTTEPVAPARPLRLAVLAPIVGLLVVGALALAGPWLAERELNTAGTEFATRPLAAYARLDRASDLDPLTDRADLLKGSIALRYGDLPRARAAFEAAVRRNPRGQYATLELGAIASVQRRTTDARRLLARAVFLAPRDQIARDALQVVQARGIVDVAALNQQILDRGQRIAQG